MMTTEISTLLLLFISIGIVKGDDSVLAQTQQGTYIGYQTSVNGTKVNSWYGIPYAQQPIGNLRWRPPQPLAISNGTYNADTPNTCPQKTTYGVLSTEACLTLNVYTPNNATSLPVYVWIHGGSFTIGAGIYYDATPFVITSMINSVPIIIVTINYRLGLLGFLADQAFYDEKSGVNKRSTTGNYGLLDQMMALDWIKKNIRAFGGNPQQITIGGESAGGISVTILLTSALVPNDTFQRAIIQSGALWPNSADPLKVATEKTGDVLRHSMNCTTVQCLRSLTVDQILAVQNIIASKSIFGDMAAPVIDGYVLNDIMKNSFARGAFQRIPVLIGSNTNETSFFTCPLFHQTANITQVEAFFQTEYNATILDEIATVYGSISTYDNPLTYLNIVFSDYWEHCASRRIASKFSSYGIPSYLYTYNYLLPETPPCLGVTHAAELPMLFPSLLPFLYPGYNLTTTDHQFSTNMMLYWANFIHTSNPNYNGSPTKWTAYLNSSDNDYVLDINPHMRNYYYEATCSRFWDRYAVTNGFSTSSGVRHTGKQDSSLLVLFVLFVSKLIGAFI